MKIGSGTALVDNDFFEHLVEIKLRSDEIAEIVKKALKSLSISAGMHPLIYKQEFVDSQNRRYFFDNNVISHFEFSDMFDPDSPEEMYYCWLIPELYRKFTGENLKADGKEVMTYWERGKSLGEVHSMTACLVCGCGMFLSDDHGSKQLKRIISRDYSAEITVYTRKEFTEALPSGTISRKESRVLSHSI